ncbi:MAG TPA: hypothetical protein VKC60_01930 [Opitutaceae bacterium]|nr:hypothetical protein [Opitutaceae bacterium]
MNIYSIVLDIHVITAILGIGPLAAAAALTTSGSSLQLLPLQRIMSLVIWSIAVMLVSGCVLVALTHGALGETWWLRISFAMFLILGFLHARVRRSLRNAGPTIDSALMRRVNRILWTMCLFVAAIAFLMQAKPW